MFIPLKDLNPSRTYPFVNVTLILANIMVFIYELGLEATLSHRAYEALLLSYSTVPARFPAFLSGQASFEVSCAPLVTSMFLHYGFLHIAGNMLSRWTDFLNSDGEKPDRNRDMEFVIESETTRDEVLAYWECGWKCVFDAIEPLSVDDFERKVMIRGQEHTIVQAINRQLMHYSYHIGQIVFLAKHFRSSEWNSLSIPRNRSAAFNKSLEQSVDRTADREKQFDAVVDFVNSKS